ncbi:hypothetical protein LTR93_007629, partial [Exophiala xenobiotica]
VLQAVIDGDLPRRMHDLEFSRRFRPLFTPRTTQGVYLIYLARRAGYEQSNARDDVGLNLTLAQLLEVADTMAKYMSIRTASNRTKANILLCKNIDSQFWCTGCTKYDYQGGRARYMANASQEECIRVWLYVLGDNILDDARRRSLENPDDPFLHVPLRRTFPYAGLSINVAARATAHHGHTGSESIVYGLFTAIVKCKYGRQFDVIDFTYQILKNVRPDDIGLLEILGSIIASAYTWDTGLSANFAGHQRGSKASDHPPTYYQDLRTNALEFRDSGIQTQQITDSIRKIEEWKQFEPRMQQMRAEGPDYKSLVEENRAKIIQLTQRAQALELDSQLTELDEVAKAYEAEKTAE